MPADFCWWAKKQNTDDNDTALAHCSFFDVEIELCNNGVGGRPESSVWHFVDRKLVDGVTHWRRSVRCSSAAACSRPLRRQRRQTTWRSRCARKNITEWTHCLFHRGVFRCIKRAGRNGISAAEKLRSIFGRVKTCEVRHRSGSVTMTIESCTNGAKTL